MGSTIGSLLGAGVGYLAFEKEAKAARDTLVHEKNPDIPPIPLPLDGPKVPTLLPPTVEPRYIDDQVKGNTFVPGHFQFEIRENSRWQK